MRGFGTGVVVLCHFFDVDELGSDSVCGFPLIVPEVLFHILHKRHGKPKVKVREGDSLTAKINLVVEYDEAYAVEPVRF